MASAKSHFQFKMLSGPKGLTWVALIGTAPFIGLILLRFTPNDQVNILWYVECIMQIIRQHYSVGLYVHVQVGFHSYCPSFIHFVISQVAWKLIFTLEALRLKSVLLKRFFHAIMLLLFFFVSLREQKKKLPFPTLFKF